MGKVVKVRFKYEKGKEKTKIRGWEGQQNERKAPRANARSNNYKLDGSDFDKIRIKAISHVIAIKCSFIFIICL